MDTLVAQKVLDMLYDQRGSFSAQELVAQIPCDPAAVEEVLASLEEGEIVRIAPAPGGQGRWERIAAPYEALIRFSTGGRACLDLQANNEVDAKREYLELLLRLTEQQWGQPRVREPWTQEWALDLGMRLAGGKVESVELRAYGARVEGSAAAWWPGE